MGAPTDEDAKRHNQDLPGMGGVFNTVNANLYHYAGNNPIKYTDPDGKKIIINGNEEDKTKILEMINAFSKNLYAIDLANNLYRVDDIVKDSTDSTRSSKYSALLNIAIESDVYLSITITDSAEEWFYESNYYKKYDVEKQGGGGCTCMRNQRDIRISLTGRDSPYEIPLQNGKSKKYSTKEILLHELVGHAIPRMLGETKGSAIEKENEIRRELNLELRKETYNDPVKY